MKTGFHGAARIQRGRVALTLALGLGGLATPGGA
jgi:hypothetical protein